ncbi:MAG TPA: hypothetical protein VK888_06925 [Anaerolineales bacterium]|nr:hypothetical protein [Anaerolineales bacterium]
MAEHGEGLPVSPTPHGIASKGAACARPMTPVVEVFWVPSLLLGIPLYSFGFIIVVVTVGSIIFNRAEQAFMYTV